MKTETECEESLRSSVKRESGEGSTSGCSTERRLKERIVPLSSVVSSVFVELTSQTSKCEPVMTEAQAETEA